MSGGGGGAIVGGSIVGGQLSGGQLSGGQLSGGQLSGGQLSGGQLSPTCGAKSHTHDPSNLVYKEEEFMTELKRNAVDQHRSPLSNPQSHYRKVQTGRIFRAPI